jgi:hypothetical protein
MSFPDLLSFFQDMGFLSSKYVPWFLSPHFSLFFVFFCGLPRVPFADGGGLGAYQHSCI